MNEKPTVEAIDHHGGRFALAVRQSKGNADVGHKPRVFRDEFSVFEAEVKEAGKVLAKALLLDLEVFSA